MNSINHTRRKWLSLGGIVLGASLLPSPLLAAVSTPKPRILRFRNINTGDKFSAEFCQAKAFPLSHLRNWII